MNECPVVLLSAPLSVSFHPRANVDLPAGQYFKVDLSC